IESGGWTATKFGVDRGSGFVDREACCYNNISVFRVTCHDLRLPNHEPRLTHNTMPIPQVAIIGRPNVGKSSLFNWLAGRRISIVDPTAGVTRDRVSTVVEHNGRAWEIMDTGGIGIVDVDDLTADVERQIQIAIDQASVVVFVVDVREGVVPLDEDVSARLRTIKKPVVLIANK